MREKTQRQLVFKSSKCFTSRGYINCKQKIYKICRYSESGFLAVICSTAFSRNTYWHSDHTHTHTHTHTSTHARTHPLTDSQQHRKSYLLACSSNMRTFLVSLFSFGLLFCNTGRGTSSTLFRLIVSNVLTFSVLRFPQVRSLCWISEWVELFLVLVFVVGSFQRRRREEGREMREKERRGWGGGGGGGAVTVSLFISKWSN